MEITSLCQWEHLLLVYHTGVRGAQLRRLVASIGANYIQLRHQKYKSLQKYERLQEFYYITWEVTKNTTGVRRRMKERRGVARRCVLEGDFPGGPIPSPQHLRTEAGGC